MRASSNPIPEFAPVTRMTLDIIAWMVGSSGGRARSYLIASPNRRIPSSGFASSISKNIHDIFGHDNLPTRLISALAVDLGSTSAEDSEQLEHRARVDA